VRIALGIEYNGHGLYGWQAQPSGVPTVQSHLEEALSKVANESVRIFCAGRTDADVHATGQVVHFDTRAKRHIDAWVWGGNTHLPSGIVIRWSKMVDYQFHARFTAISRRYRYIIFNHPIRPGILDKRVTWHYYQLNVDKINEAGVFLLGEQDFSSFRSSQCNSKTPMRSITDFQCWRSGNYVIFEIEANAFLHHMVRNIAGVLLRIGSGLKPPEWMQEVLAAKSRRMAAETAAPFGLYLIQVRYPEEYAFPVSTDIVISA
jgi:tRNA pseudouridine38-40 synthase